MCCYLVWSARLLPKEYPYAAKAAALEEDGVVFLTEMKQTNMKQNNGKKTTHRPRHDANNPVSSVALRGQGQGQGQGQKNRQPRPTLATGRTANFCNLGPEVVNVKVGEAKGGLVVNDSYSPPRTQTCTTRQLCSSPTSLVTTRRWLSVGNVLFGGTSSPARFLCTFTEPEVAHIGRTDTSTWTEPLTRTPSNSRTTILRSATGTITSEASSRCIA